ncbi:hypothetical protein GBA52_007643 [Prunus armeniaca]|nr:hypothetical protein GBA52_007643 [Prunus armeniaca]
MTSTIILKKTVDIKTWKLHCKSFSVKRNSFKKLAYAANCGEHTVFFSKRRKNSSLCAQRAAACFYKADGVSSCMPLSPGLLLLLFDVGRPNNACTSLISH